MNCKNCIGKPRVFPPTALPPHLAKIHEDVTLIEFDDYDPQRTISRPTGRDSIVRTEWRYISHPDQLHTQLSASSYLLVQRMRDEYKFPWSVLFLFLFSLHTPFSRQA